MRRSRYIEELEYNAYIEELKKGKNSYEAVRDAWEKGAPQASWNMRCCVGIFKPP